MNTFIPAQMIFYLVIMFSIVKCKESRIFKKYKENLLLEDLNLSKTK